MEQPQDEPEHASAKRTVGPLHDVALTAANSTRSVFAAFARYVAPGLAAMALVLVLAGERASIDQDLHVLVPSVALPNESLPLRALLYTQLTAPEGPVLRPQAVDVRLESATGQLLAQTRLQPARGSLADIEGSLRVPSALGEFRLVAQTRLDGRYVRTQTLLRVAQAAPVQLPEGRSLRALQQFAAGPIHAEPGETPPSALHVRVRGGACVPEQPCRALVHVGNPAAMLRIEANSTLTPSPTAAEPSQLTDAIVALDFVTHGPEAELRLVAERAGRPVARRAVRLPIALASMVVQTDTTPSHTAEPRVRVFGADGSCIVDVFAAGRWLRTGSCAACQRDNAWPFAALPAGLYRVQARSDVFSAQTAGVSSVYVRDPAEPTERMPTLLTAAARDIDASDSFVRQCEAAPTRCSDPAALAYLSAILENGVFELPPAATGYADRLTGIRERQTRLRSLSLLALALGGLSLGLHIGRRGWSAAVRARQLLQPQSLDPEFGRRARLRSLALVVASVLSLALVFVVIALYVLARGGY
jgi:hypothetical protein